ncbi:hypothetical protein FJ365_02800 [Candidatus Dependentiae bacterium]|nr:hypothetical protein [Candidatus Dependentiae bacterium]
MQKGVLLLMWGLIFCIVSLDSAAVRRALAGADEQKKKVSYCTLCNSDAQLLQLRKNINASKAYLPRAKTLAVRYIDKSVYEWTLVDIAEQEALFEQRAAQLHRERPLLCSCVASILSSSS